jgi:hypothetical protein
VFLHAEEFHTREEARRRYLQISGRLRAERDRELGCYNLLYEGRRPVVVIIREFWEMLALRHGHGRALDQPEQQHGGGTWIGPDGQEITEKPPESPRLEEWEEWGVRRRDAHDRQ